MKRFVFCFLLISLVFLFAACGEGVTTTKGDEVTTEPKVTTLPKDTTEPEVTTLPKDTTEPEVTTAQKTDPNEVAKPDDTTGEEDWYDELFGNLDYDFIQDPDSLRGKENIRERVDEITLSYTCSVEEKTFKAGEKVTFTIKVTNTSSYDLLFQKLALRPLVRLYAEGSDTPICDSQLSVISPAETTFLFAAGRTATFSIALWIPEDAAAGSYTALVSHARVNSARFEDILTITE